MASDEEGLQLLTPEERTRLDADIGAELERVRQSVIDDQLTPVTDEERSLVAMTLWRHRHGQAFGAQYCIGGSYLHDCKHVASQLGFSSHEKFSELWREILPQGVAEVEALNAIVKFSRLLGEDWGRYMFLRALRDIVELRLSPSVVADRISQGYFPIV